jgi:hypothetical protein
MMEHLAMENRKRKELDTPETEVKKDVKVETVYDRFKETMKSNRDRLVLIYHRGARAYCFQSLNLFDYLDGESQELDLKELLSDQVMNRVEWLHSSDADALHKTLEFASTVRITFVDEDELLVEMKCANVVAAVEIEILYLQNKLRELTASLKHSEREYAELVEQALAASTVSSETESRIGAIALEKIKLDKEIQSLRNTTTIRVLAPARTYRFELKRHSSFIVNDVFEFAFRSANHSNYACLESPPTLRQTVHYNNDRFDANVYDIQTMDQ